MMLRPQREVDLILSFDFSARPSDDTPPFKELLLAAKWAELNKVPFPPIDTSIIEKEGLKECYMFKHPWDPNCPIVLHFCLVNINFKREIRPGVARTTQEELDFGNFSIFDDPTGPYSTFKFTYTHLEFERLSKLMEFNTLMCKDIIYSAISTCIKRRRKFSIRRPCNKDNISRLSLNSRVKAEKLLEYIKMVDVVNGITDSEETPDSNSTSTDSQQECEKLSNRPFSSPVNLPSMVDQDEASDASNGKFVKATLSLRQPRCRRLGSHLESPLDQLVEEQELSPNSSPRSSMYIKNGSLQRSKLVDKNRKPDEESLSAQLHSKMNSMAVSSDSDSGSPRLKRKNCAKMKHNGGPRPQGKSSSTNGYDRSQQSKSQEAKTFEEWIDTAEGSEI